MEYYVEANAKGEQIGTKEHPFRWINDAAKVACAGDVVYVLPGEYREKVVPVNGGTKEKPIVYKSVEKYGAIITGAEPVEAWEKQENGVWVTAVDNGIFGEYNPFSTLVSGDWFDANYTAHTGDVYLNHKSLYEVSNKQDVFQRKENTASWDKEGASYVWYGEQKADKTILYAYFGDADPNREDVEISVRQNCFMPKKNGINYITFSGFTVREAATQWAPPTAYQDGMIGPHWAKGWMIEDCDIYESKCSGISLGKKLQPDNDNKWLKWKYKDGTQTERECICSASYDDWNKETVGSHIVRNCNIHDCGQTGIVGHLGGIFSVIENNHIYRINNKKNLAGAEIGGIKMHAAIDVQIRNNHIHHCTRGLWLDWQAQGTRVTNNVFHHNFPNVDLSKIKSKELVPVLMDIGEDLFIEVSHGPTIVDHNYLLSERSLKLAAQGVALIQNVVAGSITCVGTGTDNGTVKTPSPRYTPYHVPHGTEVAGFMTILHGDCHFYNNVFIGRKLSWLTRNFSKFVQLAGKFNPIASAWDTMNFEVGLHVFDEYPTYEEWKQKFDGYCGMGSPQSDRYYESLPVYGGNNFYCNGAKRWKKEKDGKVLQEKIEIRVVRGEEIGNKTEGSDLQEKNGYTGNNCPIEEVKSLSFIEKDDWKICTNLFEFIGPDDYKKISSADLGNAFEPEMAFETPDGKVIEF